MPSPSGATTTTLPGTGALPRCAGLAPSATTPAFRAQLANGAEQTFVQWRQTSPVICFRLSVPDPGDYPELVPCDGATGREGTIAVLTLATGAQVFLTTMYDYTLEQFGEPCYLTEPLGQAPDPRAAASTA